MSGSGHSSDFHERMANLLQLCFYSCDHGNLILALPES